MCTRFHAATMMKRYRTSAGCKVRYGSWLWFLIVCPLAYAAPCPAGQAKDESALSQIEDSWAGALEQRDQEALNCILAPEGEDADAQGKIVYPAATLAQAGNPRPAHQSSD